MSDAICTSCEQAAIRVVAPPTAMPEFRSERATLAAQAAADLYDEGYFCGESVLRVVNDLAPDPLPPSFMRLGTGFCEGMGGAGCTCGALAGAIMSMGLFAGRESLADPWEPSFFPSAVLHDKFRSSFKASCCRTIVRPFGGMDGEGRHAHCAVVTGAAAGWVVEIAEENGWL